MAKKSPAKIKMLAAEAKRNALARRQEKISSVRAAITSSEAEIASHELLDAAWRAIGLSAPACRALVGDGLFELADLRKVSLAAVKELPGMAPNSIRILVSELKKADLSFRK